MKKARTLEQLKALPSWRNDLSEKSQVWMEKLATTKINDARKLLINKKVYVVSCIGIEAMPSNSVVKITAIKTIENGRIRIYETNKKDEKGQVISLLNYEFIKL